MRTIIIGLLLCFGAGVVLGYYTALPFHWPLLIALGMIPLLFYIRHEKAFLFYVFCFTFLLGIAHERIYCFIPSHHVVHSLDRQYIVLRGMVVSDAEIAEYKKRLLASYTLRVLSIKKKNRWNKACGTVKMVVYNGKYIAYGDTIECWASVRPKRMVTNPGQFDYTEYLRHHGISGVVDVFGDASVTILHPAPQGIMNILYRVRISIRKRIELLFEEPTKSFLRALLIGSLSGIDRSLLDDFTKTGTIHILPV